MRCMLLLNSGNHLFLSILFIGSCIIYISMYLYKSYYMSIQLICQTYIAQYEQLVNNCSMAKVLTHYTAYLQFPFIALICNFLFKNKVEHVRSNLHFLSCELSVYIICSFLFWVIGLSLTDHMTFK